MYNVGNLLYGRADGTFSGEHDTVGNKREQAVLFVPHMLLALIYPPSLQKWIAIVAWRTVLHCDVAEDGQFFGFLSG